MDDHRSERIAGILPELVELRHTLHREPELSGQEHATARRLATVLQAQSPDQLLTELGGTGLAAVFDGALAGPTLLLRCELDALPIQERGAGTHCSTRPGVAHLCGHDGHMATLVGVAMLLHRQPPRRGRVVLLFQPAEETAVGARTVLADPAFNPLQPDLAVAWHNIPRHPRGAVLLRSGVMASASVGLIARLEGVSAHAAHPERGNSPALAFADLIRDLSALPARVADLDTEALSTVVHARLGTVAFGTTPGEAEVMATLRAIATEDLDRLRSAATELIKRRARAAGLRHDLQWVEEFPETRNANQVVQLLRAACTRARLQPTELAQPFRWSEDFGYFTSRYPGALFCIGAGADHPPVHHPDYDFPDELIGTALQVLTSLIELHGDEE
jgi:amidohydrolase